MANINFITTVNNSYSQALYELCVEDNVINEVEKEITSILKLIIENLEFKNLIKNPTITDLVGGIQYVTLGDEEAKRRGSSKSILERKAPPTFDAAIEIQDTNTWVIHDNIEQSVDSLLQGQNFPIQQRSLINQNGSTNLVDCRIIYNQKDNSLFITTYTLVFSKTKTKKVYKIC